MSVPKNTPTSSHAASPAPVDEELVDVAPDRSRGLPYPFARRYGLAATRVHPDGAQISHREPLNVAAVNEARRYLGVPLRLTAVDAAAFDRLIGELYGGGGTMHAMEDFGDTLDLAHMAEALEPEDLMESEDDAPVIRLINALLAEAIKEGASDIHIEPYEQRLVVRFRVDGVLREVLQPRSQIAPLLVSRIKVMANLDIAEKRVPQDGRISLRLAGRPVDVRVSTLPSSAGERVVLRLLDKQAGRLDLEHLGMAGVTQERMDTLIHLPHGILLVTGPTGSGKTTTLYAALTRLNDRSRNIVTVEDPIEYYLDGIGQTQVNTKVDLTFARGLRAILRQDPDVVMVGEIRDLETARIAVQASLTGHLVLSTLHTNTAVGAITRLRDMGVEPFLLASSLVGVLAQRLVRLLCNHCKQPYAAAPRELELLGVHAGQGQILYRAVGCEHCHRQGYAGRTGIYELIDIDEPQRQLILDGAGEAAMRSHARQTTPGLRRDGLRRVLAGQTTIDEVLRVTADD